MIQELGALPRRLNVIKVIWGREGTLARDVDGVLSSR